MALVGTCSAPDEASVRSAAAKRLRSFGINTTNYRLHSSSSRSQNSTVVFGVSLNAVPHQNVKCCGQILQIPIFVHQLCTALKLQMTIEGLFRKAGSQMRQKEMKRSIDCGGKIDKSYHAIDLASLLKQYLRALPEPVIKSDLQEILVRCLLLPESDRLCAINLSLLMMSTPQLHLLHYIMEFFKCVSLKSDSNKMDCNNLAIVISPTIMPPPLTCPVQRLDYHLKLIKILIENSNMIGMVSDNLCVLDNVGKEVQKKKKRRSGSLTRMFTGLRKMVTNSTSKSTNPDILATPILDKGQNKRKQEESQAFSAKKRKEILDSLPLQTFSTPIRPLADKEQKKLRLSIGKRAKDKNLQKVSNKSKENQYCGVLDKLEKSSQEFDLKSCLSSDLMEIDLSNNKDSDYVRIPKSEYEAIKNRVSAIENRISQEFNVITAINETEPVQQVQTAYEKTLEEAAMLSSPGSEQIARRRSRELKIRQSGEHKIIRSPSARKIGIIRRRSREITTKLIRTQTWTVSSNTGLHNITKTNQFYTAASLKRGRPNTVNTGLLQPNSNNVNTPIKKYSASKRGSFDESFHIRSPSIDNDILTNRDYLSKNRLKRPSSFHGHVEIGNHGSRSNVTRANIKVERENNWKNPESLLSSMESLENPLTGRASVAKLRSQMAGMVLAKARLFDGMTDSDSSLEKKINTRPSRQISSFARKSRKCISPEKNMFVGDTSDEFSPQFDSKLAKKAPYKSPGLVSKRHRNRATRSPLATKRTKENLNLSSQLKEVIYDICTPLSEKVNINNGQAPTQKLKESSRNNAAFKSPRSTPHIKKSLHSKSGIGLKNTQNSIETKKVNTPMRANHNTPRRQSPRLLSMKARQLV